MLYATAALLEGCSFVNGGSQNTLCRGLSALADEQQAYCLGTDFKAGQTKVRRANNQFGLDVRSKSKLHHLSFDCCVVQNCGRGVY